MLDNELVGGVLCAIAPGREPLEWAQVAYVGRFETHPMGPFEIKPDDIRAMVANFQADPRGRIVVDYEHQTLRARENGRPAPASGWCVALEARDEEATLYGKIEWTERASNSIRASEYAFLSPVLQFAFRDKETGQKRGTRLHSIALTNQPFLDKLPAVAAGEDPMNPELLQLLGLSEADSGKAMQALQRLVRLAKVGEHALSAASLSTDLEAERACAALTPILQHAGFVPKETHDTVLRQLSEAKASGTVEQLLAEARDKGVIVPATETWARDFAARDADGFQRWCSAAPRVAPKAAGNRTNPTEEGVVALSEDDRTMMRKLNLTEAQWRAALPKKGA